MKYPLYRRYINGRSYFKLESPSRMLEVQVLGKYYIEHELVAKILPERLLMSDLIEANPDSYEVISEEIFENFMLHNRENRILRQLGI